MSPLKGVAPDHPLIAFPSLFKKKDLLAIVEYLLSSLSGRKELKMANYPSFGNYGPVLKDFDQDDTLPWVIFGYFFWVKKEREVDKGTSESPEWQIPFDLRFY